MAKVKFGPDQIGKPNPGKITRNLAIAAFVFSTINTYMGAETHIPPILSSVLQGLCGLLATVCLGLIPFFGVEVTQQKVDIDKVDVVKEDEVK